MIPEEHRPFRESHRLAIVGFARKGSPPPLSPVYYDVDGDENRPLNDEDSWQGHGSRPLGEFTLCIAVAATARMAKVIKGNALPGSARPVLEERAQSEGRVAVRVKPYSFFKTDPVGVRPSTS